MKKISKILIFIVIFVVIIALVVGYFMFYNKENRGNKEDVKEEDKRKVIVSKITFKNDEFIALIKDNVYVRENKKIVVKSLNNEVKEKTDYETVEWVGDLVSYYKDEKTIIKNQSGKVLVNGKEPAYTLYDEVKDKSYYKIGKKFYDSEGILLFDNISDVRDISNGLIYNVYRKQLISIIDIEKKKR